MNIEDVVEEFKIQLEMMGDDSIYITIINNYINELTTKHQEELEKAVEEIRSTLSELYAIVHGECPRLFNEDSGGNPELEHRILQTLTPTKTDKQ